MEDLFGATCLRAGLSNTLEVVAIGFETTPSFGVADGAAESERAGDVPSCLGLATAGKVVGAESAADCAGRGPSEVGAIGSVPNRAKASPMVPKAMTPTRIRAGETEVAPPLGSTEVLA